MNRRFRGHWFGSCCAILFGLGNLAIAEENFDWQVPDDGTDGCWEVTEDEPTKPCDEYWLDPFGRPAGIFCSGLCNVANGALTCVLSRQMEHYASGPDRHTEKLTYRKVIADPGEPQGNELRKRYLKCVVLGECLCRFNQQHQKIFCILDPDTESFSSVELFIYDANGPECEEEEEEEEGEGFDDSNGFDEDQWNEDEDWGDGADSDNVDTWLGNELDDENGGLTDEQP